MTSVSVSSAFLLHYRTVRDGWNVNANAWRYICNSFYKHAQFVLIQWIGLRNAITCIFDSEKLFCSCLRINCAHTNLHTDGGLYSLGGRQAHIFLISAKTTFPKWLMLFWQGFWWCELIQGKTIIKLIKLVFNKSYYGRVCAHKYDFDMFPQHKLAFSVKVKSKGSEVGVPAPEEFEKGVIGMWWIAGHFVHLVFWSRVMKREGGRGGGGGLFLDVVHSPLSNCSHCWRIKSP